MKAIAEADLFHESIRHWWSSKRVKKSRKSQGGTRDANLHGKTMDGFARALREFLIGLNVDPDHIFSGGHLSTSPAILPSHFRPSKNWDFIVLANSRCYPAPTDEGSPVLYAAVEFKSQDKSIGNNQNNRLEESLGNALDFWTTYSQSGFERQQPRPWLGYLFVGNYDPESDGVSVKIKQPHFPATPSFRTVDWSEKSTYDGPSYGGCKVSSVKALDIGRAPPFGGRGARRAERAERSGPRRAARRAVAGGGPVWSRVGA